MTASPLRESRLPVGSSASRISGLADQRRGPRRRAAADRPRAGWGGARARCAMPTFSSASVDARLPLRRLHAAVGERQLDVLEDREVANQVEALEDEPDLAVADARALRHVQVRHRAGRSACSVPPVGVSSRPRIDRSVDLPQPDGPAIDTYSPLLDLHVDAGERVRLDFVGVEHLRHAVQLDQRPFCVAVAVHRASRDRFLSCRAATACHRTVQSYFKPHPIERVALRHVGEDHLVALLQAAQDFDRVHRRPPELHLHARPR